MNKDIRIIVSLPDHHKTNKLIRRVGEGAFRCLIRLWCYAAENRPNGILSGMDAIDIAIASGWGGNEQEWIDALASTGWIDIAEDEIILHDWEVHNTYAFHAEERSEKARNAAKAKWARRNGATGNATSINEDNPKHEGSNPPFPDPIPSPSPNPTPNSVSCGRERKENLDGGAADHFETFWKAYPSGRKQGKPKCLAKYLQIVKSGQATTQKLLDGALRYAAAGYDGSRFVKGPLVWLNGGHWTDEDVPTPGDKLPYGVQPRTPHQPQPHPKSAKAAFERWKAETGPGEFET